MLLEHSLISHPESLTQMKLQNTIPWGPESTVGDIEDGGSWRASFTFSGFPAGIVSSHISAQGGDTH